MTIETALPPHVQRMIGEAGELAEKICNLGRFLEGSIFQTLAETDQSLMQAQIGAMTAYLSVLQIRIMRSTAPASN